MASKGKRKTNGDALRVDQFARYLKDGMDANADRRMAFFLGAGCSISSGIDASKKLVNDRWLPRLHKIYTDGEGEIGGWAATKYPGYIEENAASYYGQVIDDLFHTNEERQDEFEKLTSDIYPGFGYATLAQLISHARYGRRCNVVLTTNFDDMVADALYLYTTKKPLIISHESLAGFVRISEVRRPVCIKMHGDVRLEMKHTDEDTGHLDPEVKEVLQKLLCEMGLIFIGYGGHDKSVVTMLEELPANKPPWGIFWVNETWPEGKFGKWLESHKAVWVQQLDFDELMFHVKDVFSIPDPNRKRFEHVFESYQKTLKKFTEKKGKSKESDEAVTRFVEYVEKEKFSSAYDVILRANLLEISDPERADRVYRAGIRIFPNNADLIGNYAIFQKNIRKDYGRAEYYYKIALEKFPELADPPCNYANFLKEIRKDNAGAKDYYWKSLEKDPDSANNLGHYASLLFVLEKSPNQNAFKWLEKAFKAIDDPDSGIALECWFYRYAHDNNRRIEALVEIKRLLEMDVRSLHWNLDDNITRAIEDGHPEPGLVNAIARVISGDTPLEDLNSFDAWKKAGKRKK